MLPKIKPNWGHLVLIRPKPAYIGEFMPEYDRLSQTKRNFVNYVTYGISDVEQGELRLSNGNLAKLNFDEPNYSRLTEVNKD